MRLAVLGGNTSASAHFVRHAKHDGFSVSQESGDQIDTCIRSSHAVICLPDFLLSQTSLAILLESMEQYGVPRLIIANASLMTQYDSYTKIKEQLENSTIDWTLVQTISEAEDMLERGSPSDFLVEARDLATFLVNQITDSRYLQTTVLVKS